VKIEDCGTKSAGQNPPRVVAPIEEDEDYMPYGTTVIYAVRCLLNRCYAVHDCVTKSHT